MAFAKEYLFFLIIQFGDFLICAVWPTVYKSCHAVTDEFLAIANSSQATEGQEDDRMALNHWHAQLRQLVTDRKKVKGT